MPGHEGNHVIWKKRDIRKIQGYRGRPEIHENQEKRDMRKKWGTRKFRKIMTSGKNGTFANFDRTFGISAGHS